MAHCGKAGRKKKPLEGAGFHVLVILLGLLMIYPLAWMLFASFKGSDEIFTSSSLLPKTWVWSNYVDGWYGLPKTTFAHFFANTACIVAAALIGNLISCSMTAYAFSKCEFRFKNLFFGIMMGTLMLPKHVKLIPQYILFNRFGMVNTFWPLILPKFLAVEGFFVYLMTQYARSAEGAGRGFHYGWLQ